MASEFHDALKEAIETENKHRDTLELVDFTDNWQAIAEELAASPDAPTVDTRSDAEAVHILFTDKEAAVTQIVDAYATVEDSPLDSMPQASEAIRNALTNAYRRAVEAFQDRIEGNDLERRFNTATDLVLAERLADIGPELPRVTRTHFRLRADV